MNNTSKEQLLSFGYNKETVIAAIVASIAAMLTSISGIAPWVMFIGWVAFFTNPTSFTNAAKSALCVSLGIILGTIAYSSIGVLSAYIGVYALSVVVFVVAFFVLTLRVIPLVNNIVAWFLGLITFFALHAEVTLSTIVYLILTVCFGVVAGFIAMQLQQKSRN